MSESLNNAQIAAQEIMPEEEVEFDQSHASGVVLSKVDIDDGEQNEDVVLCERAALYRFIEDDWKERARGDVKILRHKETKRYRVVMRQEKTLKVRLNQHIGDIQLKPNPGSDKAWTWRWQDYATDSGEPETHTFAIRFRTAEIAKSFQETWEEARKFNVENKPAASASASDDKADEKKNEDKAEDEAPKEDKDAKEPVTDEKKEEKAEETAPAA